MSRSKYSRFKNGVQIAGLPIQVPHTGRTYFVCNSTTAAELQPYGLGGSDGNDGLSPEQPFATIGYAITRCSAGRGDTIFVMPGHAESLIDATTCVLNISHVNIIGLGNGEKRPIISFATSTSAAIPVTGANARFENLVFKCNIASQLRMLDLAAKDVQIINCDFREGTATGISFIAADTADNDTDRLLITNCSFYAPTAGNMDNAIVLGKDFLNAVIVDNEIDGDFDTAGISVPVGGNAQVNLRIIRNTVKNRLTTVAAIAINGTGSSGFIQDCFLRTDTLSSALDNGSLATDNVTWADETDQVSSTPVFISVDSVSNPIGADNSNNAFASTSVVANADGSVLEREEYIQTDMLGLPRSIASTAKTLTTGNINMFTISGGPIKVLELVGIVTTIVQAQATSTKITVTTTAPAATVDFSAAAVDLTGAAAGASIRHINTTGILTVVTAGFVNEGNAFATQDTQYLVPAGTMQINNASASNTGAITWYMRYVPLSPLSRVA